MIKLNDKQLDYLKAPIFRNTYLRACPGSGKTEIISYKFAQEMKKWNRFPAGMGILSFSRSATAELIDRIADARRGNRKSHPHFIGTVDSFILKNIVTPLAHIITGFKGRDGDYSLRVVDEHAVIHHRTKYAYVGINLPANRFDWDTATKKYIFRHPSDGLRRKLNALVLEDWQIADLDRTKAKFYESGFATYRDVEILALKILKRNDFHDRIGQIAARYPFIVIDECQDLSSEQIGIFSHLSKRDVNFHMVGDLNQAIYGFRNCFPDDVMAFVKELQCNEMQLDENHRSGQAIVDIQQKLIKSGKITGRANYAEKTCYLVEYKTCPSEAIDIFAELAKGHKRSVIVARGHSTLARLNFNTKGESPVETLARAIMAFSQTKNSSFRDSLGLFASYIAQNCISTETWGEDAQFRPFEMESAEEWHRFLFNCLDGLVAEGLGNTALTWADWCRALKKALANIQIDAAAAPCVQQALTEFKKKQHNSPAKMGANPIGLSLVTNLSYQTHRLATIHEVKGETHDITMLVSSRRKGHDAHWKDWIEDATTEAARFAYVGSSRPKHILIWAVKTLKRKEREQLMGIGFHANLICQPAK